MANLNDLFNVVNEESLDDAPGNSFKDKVQEHTQGLQKLQTKLTEASEPKVQDLVTQKLASLTGANRGKQGLVEKTADESIQKLLHSGDPLQEGIKTGFMSGDDLSEPKDAKTPSAPAGYQWADPDDTSKGLSPIAGGPATKMAAEQVGKAQLMVDATKDLDTIKGYLFDKDGNINRGVIAGMTTIDMPLKMFDIAGIPFTDGKSVANMMTVGVEGALRLLTGATVNIEELPRTRSMYFPRNFDTDHEIRKKYLRYRSFVLGTAELLTSGRRPGLTKEVMIDGKKTRVLDPTKAAKFQSQIDGHLARYRNKWIKQCQKQYPSANYATCDKAWTKKEISDPNLMKGFKYKE